MRKTIDQLNQIPSEYPNDVTKEFVPLPDEFNRFPQTAKPKEKCEKRRMLKWLLAAAGLAVLGILPLTVRTDAVKEAAVVSDPETPVPGTAVEATPIQTPVPTPAPTEAPTLSPTETPKVTPVPTPGVSVSYYYRASEVYYAMLIVSVPERVSSVSFRLVAPDVEEPALEIELTPQQIEDRIYVLRVGNRDDGFDANEFFAHHAEADLTMELTYTIVGDAGEETRTETFEPTVEDWIYWRFDSEEDVGGIGEMMFGDIFPNCFTVRIFDSLNGELNLTVGSDADALGNGDVTISVLIDGREIPAEGSRLLRGMYRYEGDDTIFYDYALVIPLPEDFPQHGTATMTLTRKLTRGEAIIVEVKNVDY